MDVAVIGGTGAEGFGLSLRLATAGHHVIIGSRDASRGADAAAKAAELTGVGIDGTDNASAALGVGEDGVVAVTVPYAGQAEIYRSIKDAVADRGSVVLDATSPLATAVGGRPWQVLRPWHGSAAEQAQAILGSARVIAALHTIAAEALQDLDHDLDSDVLVCGDDADAKARVGSLIEDIPGLRWVDGGRLEMARVAEPLTALLVSINRTYRVKDSGFRITGRDAWGSPPLKG